MDGGQRYAGDVLFEETMKMAGFEKKTIAVLLKNDFKSTESLQLLDGDAFNELKLGAMQCIRLQQYVAAENARSDGVTCTTLREQPIAADPPHTAQQTRHASIGVKQANTMNFSHMFLKGGCSSQYKFRDIAEFTNARQVDEKVLYNDGIELVLRTTSFQPQNTSIEEWYSANTQIMFELLDEGKLNMKTVNDYIVYTVKVCDFYKQFDKASVMAYDRAYRYLQSIHGFRWGTDVSHLHTYLRAKPRSYSRPSSGSKVDKPNVCRPYVSTSGSRKPHSPTSTHVPQAVGA